MAFVWFVNSGFTRILIGQLNSRCYRYSYSRTRVQYAILNGSVFRVKTHQRPNKPPYQFCHIKFAEATCRWLAREKCRGPVKIAGITLVLEYKYDTSTICPGSKPYPILSLAVLTSSETVEEPGVGSNPAVYHGPST